MVGQRVAVSELMGTGITTALKVKVEKGKKRPDNEKGGFASSGGRGKIIGGKRKGGDDDEGKFGAMSEVILLKGMVDGLDLDVEMGAEGTLVQEIGEECGEKVSIHFDAVIQAKLTFYSMDELRESSSNGTLSQRAFQFSYTSQVNSLL